METSTSSVSTLQEEEEDEELLQILLDREISIDVLQRNHEFTSGPWIQEARLNAIKYILATGGLFGFSIQAAFLSVTYLDRFLSRRSIDDKKDWAIKLLSMACLSLAAKMEECKVPSLTEYPMEGHNFESKFLQKMELLVLNTFGWKMRLITPFAFTGYFASKFGKNCQRKDVVSRSTEIILRAMKDIKLMSYRSSVLAAAATLVALDQGLNEDTIELKINALPSSGIIKIDDILFCYNQMRELNVDKNDELRESCILFPHLLSPNQILNSNVKENPIVSYALSSRRRLTFEDRDDSSNLPQEKRQR